MSFLCFPVYANSVIPRVGPCPPLPPSPPLRPFGLLRGHCRATLALLWLCLNHYCTPGGGLKTVMLVPPPPANRLYSSYVTIISIPLVIVYLSNSWNKYFYCLLFTVTGIWGDFSEEFQVLCKNPRKFASLPCPFNILIK